MAKNPTFSFIFRNKKITIHKYRFAIKTLAFSMFYTLVALAIQMVSKSETLLNTETLSTLAWTSAALNFLIFGWMFNHIAASHIEESVKIEPILPQPKKEEPKETANG